MLNKEHSTHMIGIKSRDCRWCRYCCWTAIISALFFSAPAKSLSIFILSFTLIRALTAKCIHKKNLRLNMASVCERVCLCVFYFMYVYM